MELESKYNPQEVEPRIYQYWCDNNFFHAQRDAQKEPFTIMIPPPNITGILHMGHALNNTIQDVLIRFYRMKGKISLWMPGTDHAGIATQNVVERSLAKENKTKEDLGKEAFHERLWEWTSRYGTRIINQLKQLGASCDWERTRFTLDKEYSDAVKEVFIRLYEKGLIYRGKYIINWCPRCKTALSDEESPYQSIEGFLYYIRYPVKKDKTKEGNTSFPEYIVVATTRPETMLGDTAIAINPEDKRYRWLKDVCVLLPIMERELVLIEDEMIDREFGTGVVKVTPAHDPADFLFGKKYNLPFINIMNEDATINENGGQFQGMDRFKARERILTVLEKQGLLEKKEPYQLNAGHCYRCHTIIEPRISLQWFVKMKPLAQPAIKVVEENKVTFYPERWKKVYLNWMYNIQDWCISRQIWWGHQIPVYYCCDCLGREGSNEISLDAGWSQGVMVAKVKPVQCPYCKSTRIEQDPDVLDTWFSSWLWPFATLYWPFSPTNSCEESSFYRDIYAEFKAQKDSVDAQQDFAYFYPSNILVTASEILFFWVARMIMAGMEFIGQIPFKDVIIHGTVRDETGIKMSKSLGNTIDPLEVIEKFGADALRFSLMMLASTGSDVYLSDDKFLVGRNFANKIWNCARFFFAKIEDQGIQISECKILPHELDAVDVWLLCTLNTALSEVTEALKRYEINEAAKKNYEFFWHVLCDWYIEMVKINFSLVKAKVLLHSLLTSLKMLHPIMPFLTEEVFQKCKEKFPFIKEKSIMTSDWPQSCALEGVERNVDLTESVITFIKEVRNIKADLGVAPSQKISGMIKASSEARLFFDRQREWILRLAGLQMLKYEKCLEREIYSNPFFSFQVDASLIDQHSFRELLSKKTDKLVQVIERTEKKISNEQFLKNAPPSTVEAEKDKYSNLRQQYERLEKLKKNFTE